MPFGFLDASDKFTSSSFRVVRGNHCDRQRRSKLLSHYYPWIVKINSLESAFRNDFMGMVRYGYLMFIVLGQSDNVGHS